MPWADRQAANRGNTPRHPGGARICMFLSGHPSRLPAFVPVRRLSVALAAIGLAALALASGLWATRDELPRDFGSFWASGNAANHGDDPYGVYPETFRVDGTDRTAAPNLNPPASILALQLLAKLDLHNAHQVWRLVSIAVYGIALAALVSAYPERRSLLIVLWAVNLAGFWHVVELGQLYVPLLALTVAAWVSLRDGRVLPAAIALGLLIAIKPNFIVWPLLLLIAGRRDFALPSLVACAGFALLPIVLRGPAVYESWLAATPSFEDAGLSMSMIGGNFSFIAMSGRLGLWQAGVLLSAVMLVMCALVAWRRVATLEALSGLAITSALLIGPVTWAGYSILLLPVFFCLRWTPALVLAAALLCWPFWLLIEAEQAWAVPPELMESVYGIGALLVVAELVRAIMQTSAPNPTPVAGDSASGSRPDWQTANP
jgi:hypothetical protein